MLTISENNVQLALEYRDYFSNMLYKLNNESRHASTIRGYKTGRQEFTRFECAQMVVMCRALIGEKTVEDIFDNDYIRKVSRIK